MVSSRSGSGWRRLANVYYNGRSALASVGQYEVTFLGAQSQVGDSGRQLEWEKWEGGSIDSQRMRRSYQLFVWEGTMQLRQTEKRQELQTNKKRWENPS